MIWLIGSIALLTGSQTFVNDNLDDEAIITELSHNLDAVRFVSRGKVYLKPERIIPSDSGMLLVKDDLSTILLPKVFSDRHGCYILCGSDCRIALQLLNCWNCSFKFPPGRYSICPRCQMQN